MTIQEHSRRYELITRKYSGQPLLSGLTEQVLPAPSLSPNEQIELDWLESKIQVEYGLFR